jgi:charged multivesicular body protein 2A
LGYRDKSNIDLLHLTQLVKAPATAVSKPVAAGKAPAQAEAAGGMDGGIDDDLQARLDNLRKM